MARRCARQAASHDAGGGHRRHPCRDARARPSRAIRRAPRGSPSAARRRAPRRAASPRRGDRRCAVAVDGPPRDLRSAQGVRRRRRLARADPGAPGPRRGPLPPDRTRGGRDRPRLRRALRRAGDAGHHGRSQRRGGRRARRGARRAAGRAPDGLRRDPVAALRCAAAGRRAGASRRMAPRPVRPVPVPGAWRRARRRAGEPADATGGRLARRGRPVGGRGCPRSGGRRGHATSCVPRAGTGLDEALRLRREGETHRRERRGRRQATPRPASRARARPRQFGAAVVRAAAEPTEERARRRGWAERQRWACRWEPWRDAVLGTARR